MNPADRPLAGSDWSELSKSLELESEEIRKSAEVLIESNGKPSKYREGLLEDIVRRTHHIDQTARKIHACLQALTSAHQQSTSAVLLAELVRECVKQAAPALEKHSTNVRVFIDPEIIVKMDPGVLKPIMDELIANAVEHNPPLAWIKIEAHGVMDEIVVTVKDCGTGIAKSDLEKLFDKKPGASAKDSGKLLGLPEIRQILRSYGQKIWANSAFGKGTTIYLTLPAATTDS